MGINRLLLRCFFEAHDVRQLLNGWDSGSWMRFSTVALVEGSFSSAPPSSAAGLGRYPKEPQICPVLSQLTRGWPLLGKLALQELKLKGHRRTPRPLPQPSRKHKRKGKSTQLPVFNTYYPQASHCISCEPIYQRPLHDVSGSKCPLGEPTLPTVLQPGLWSPASQHRRGAPER